MAPADPTPAAARDFDERVSDYRRTTREAPRTGAKAARYASATASALALAGGAEAGVIYSGVQNLSFELVPPGSPATPQQSLDLDLDGAFGDDVRLRMYWYTYSRVSGGAYSTYFFYTNQAVAGLQQVPFVLPNAADLLLNGTFDVQRLSSGQTISAGAGAFGDGWRRLNSYSEFSGLEQGTWPASGAGFVGLALKRGADTHYGWIRLQLEDQGSLNGPPDGASDKITVVDWAWETVADRPIVAGAVVPEPSTLQLLAAGALGVHVFRKRTRREDRGEA